ncbi:hypothetical protein ACP70R_047918 [Stipagrostis hirtigluma subsp. patula]
MAREMPSGGGDDSASPHLATVKELWNAWEIHCLVLVSLFLQVFLFLTADTRRRSTSRLLRVVLWLAYLSADSVAIYVLGHLAVHMSEPRHQLMSFWAPFVLVHLGGQDTITAFSKQDNELWMRHLLSFVSQLAVAGYVVAKASWPDRRLRAAMALMFLSGCFKYAGRIFCLYISSLSFLRGFYLEHLSDSSTMLLTPMRSHERSWTMEMLRVMSNRSPRQQTLVFIESLDTEGYGAIPMDLAGDAPSNKVDSILVADELPRMLEDLLPGAEPTYRWGPYEFVGAILIECYKRLYTKQMLRYLIWRFRFLHLCHLLHFVSTPIALVLFIIAKKGDRLRTSRADITVSYMLLVGAIVLDVSSSIKFIVSNTIRPYQPTWTGKQWSEELAQYKMINRYVVQHTTCMVAIKQWIGKRLGALGVDLLDLTHISINKDHTPIKEFILDNLLRFGIGKEWNCSSSRGQLALQKWLGSHHDPDSERTGKTLGKSLSSGVDFPTSVLIWHIATEICYYVGDSISTNCEEVKVSRELSNYIMYLVFKCDVVLTGNSRIIHDNAHREIRRILLDSKLQQKDAVMKIFKANEKVEQQGHSTVEIEKHEEPANNSNVADSHVQHLQKLRQSAQAINSPVLPRACEVAQELISINSDAERWGLISAVWSEMLYYTAPRCGGVFHYEHLSMGGEFITHVLLLMRYLGPFIPPK